LARVLSWRGHEVDREVRIPINFKGDVIGLQRVDMLIDKRVILEIKSTHDLAKVSHRQLLANLRGSNLQVGLLLHFGPRPEFYRVVNTRSRTSRPDSP
jgi:GxxExxY protein